MSINNFNTTTTEPVAIDIDLYRSNYCAYINFKSRFYKLSNNIYLDKHTIKDWTFKYELKGTKKDLQEYCLYNINSTYAHNKISKQELIDGIINHLDIINPNGILEDFVYNTDSCNFKRFNIKIVTNYNIARVVCYGQKETKYVIFKKDKDITESSIAEYYRKLFYEHPIDGYINIDKNEYKYYDFIHDEYFYNKEILVQEIIEVVQYLGGTKVKYVEEWLRDNLQEDLEYRD